MFDTYYAKTGSGHTSVSTTVTEKRAPTDESVRLLKEMERAAHDKVLKAIHVADMGFECVIHHMEMHLSGQAMLAAVFKLNGKKMEATYTFTHYRNPSMEDVINGLRDEVAKVIANEIAPAFNQVHRQLNLKG